MNTNDNKFNNFCQTLGLHPLVAFGLFAADWMLFGGEGATGFLGLLITIPVGFMLGVASIFLQRSLYKDSWGAAVGKGLMMGLLTAIPTALPSFGLLPFAAIGGIKYLMGKEQAQLPERNG
jgi:hypothetical protein